MARSFISGGVSATGLATGKPYVKRIVRKGSDGGAGREDGLTCRVVPAGDNQGAISFSTVDVDANITGSDGKGKNWATEGELLFVEFPSTTRTLSVNAEGASEAGVGKFRLKVMLVAPDQRAFGLDSRGDVTTRTVDLEPYKNSSDADRLLGGNFIEINFTNNEIATINARTKGVFILIEKFANDLVFDTDGNVLARGETYDSAGENITPTTDPADAVSILVTAILDHEGFGSAGGVETKRVDKEGNTTSLRKIWPMNVNSTNGVG